jgi:hypothetical protein
VQIYYKIFSFISNCFVTIISILIKSTYLISFFSTFIILYIIYHSGFTYADNHKTSKSYNYHTESAFSYTFIFFLVFIFVYMILSFYTASPLGLEESSNAPLEGKATFIGVSTPVATAWIAATGAVVATVTAPPAVKMKLLGGGSLGGLGMLNLADRASNPQNWTRIKEWLQSGLTEDKSSSVGTTPTKELSVFPFDFDFFGMMNSFFGYFPSLKTILLERLPDQCPENFIMTYQTLFTQYNVMVLISLVSLSISVCLFTVIYILNLLKIHKLYFLDNNYYYLGKLASSRYTDYYIGVLTLSLYLNFAALGKCLYFMYLNYIPCDIGNITDIAIQNKQDMV